MNKTTITVPVFVLTDDDVADITDDARATGKLSKHVEALEDKIRDEVGNDRLSVAVGFSRSRYGGVDPFVRVAGVKLLVGEAVALLPTGAAKIPTPAPAEAPKAKKTTKKAAAQKSEATA